MIHLSAKFPDVVHPGPGRNGESCIASASSVTGKTVAGTLALASDTRKRGACKATNARAELLVAYAPDPDTLARIRQ